MRKLVVFVLFSMITVSAGHASNCEGKTVEQIIAEADALFTGVVERDTRVRVIEAFKGVAVGDRVPTRGGFAGTVGESRTYAAYRQPDGVVRIITGPHSRAYYCESPTLAVTKDDDSPMKITALGQLLMRARAELNLKNV